jgi:Fe-S oxidoreductase
VTEWEACDDLEIDGEGSVSVEGIFDSESEVVYVPDCETRSRRPEDVLKTGRLLERLLGRKVSLHAQHAGRSQCCGFPLGAAGDRSGWADQWTSMQEVWPAGATVICECPAMVAQLRDGTSFGPDSESGLPADAIEDGLSERVEHIIEVLDARVPEEPPSQPVSADDWMLHDSCFTTRQLSLAEPTRRVLEHLCAEGPREFHVGGEEAPCCGGPAHYHLVAPEASEQLAVDRLKQMRAEGGEAVVCGSSTCRKAFARADDAAVAGDVLELAWMAYDISVNP